MTTRRKRQIGYTLVIFWMALIFFLSQQDASVSSQQSGVIVDYVRPLLSSITGDLLTFLTRKSAHIFMYFVLGGLLYNVARTYSLATRKAVVLCILIAMSFAISDEIHQTFVAGRSGEVRDVLIDTTASAAGIGLYAWKDRRKKRSLLQKTTK